MALLHLNQEGLDKILASDTPVLVDFWATWCTHCKPLIPVFEQLAEEYEGKNVVIGKVDVDEEPGLAGRYGVMGVPTVLLLRGDRELDRKVGAMPYDAYAEALDELLDGGMA